MNRGIMLKYLFFTRDSQLNTASVYVVCMAVIAGLSFFALAVMIFASTIEVINGRYPLDHLAWSAVVFFVFITTKHLSLISGNDLIERALEKERNRLADPSRDIATTVPSQQRRSRSRVVPTRARSGGPRC